MSKSNHMSGTITFIASGNISKTLHFISTLYIYLSPQKIYADIISATLVLLNE